MGPASKIPADLVLRVVRGTAHWSSLKDAGHDVRRKGNEWIIPALDQEIEVDARDVTAGLLALHSKPSELQEWASYLLADSLLSFDRFADSDIGDRLLGALWDLAFGASVNDDLLTFAQSVE